MMQPGYVEIITPEGVKLQFETAGIGARAMALTIDMVIMMFLVALIMALTVPMHFFDDLWAKSLDVYSAVAIAAVAFITIGYFILFELLFKGQTPGKRWTRIRVVKINGSPATAGSVIMRNLIRVIDQLPVFYVIGIIAVFISPQERRIGDLIAGTMVVKEFGRKPLKMKPLAVYSLSADVSLGPHEIRVLQSFFYREKELAKNRREQLLREYTSYFQTKYGVYPQKEEKPADFLKYLLLQSESARAQELPPTL